MVSLVADVRSSSQEGALMVVMVGMGEPSLCAQPPM